MTKRWLTRPLMTATALLLAGAVALPLDAAARDGYYRGGYGYHHYDRGYHGGYRHGGYHHGYWSGGRWVAGAIVAGAVIGLVDNALSPPPPVVVYERPVYRRPVRVVYEQPVVTRRVVETRTVYEDSYPPTRYLGYEGE